MHYNENVCTANLCMQCRMLYISLIINLEY